MEEWAQPLKKESQQMGFTAEQRPNWKVDLQKLSRIPNIENMRMEQKGLIRASVGTEKICEGVTKNLLELMKDINSQNQETQGI